MELLSENELIWSPVVANSAMNRERNSSGIRPGLIIPGRKLLIPIMRRNSGYGKVADMLALLPRRQARGIYSFNRRKPGGFGKLHVVSEVAHGVRRVNGGKIQFM